MARHEFQDPSVLKRAGKLGDEWYIRYRVKVLDADENGRPQVRRQEKWVRLGLCSEMTERQAKRRKDELMREVNGQVYTLQTQIPFIDFLKLYREKHLPTLAVPTQWTYSQWLSKHIEPAFAGKRLYEIKIPDIQGMLLSLQVAPKTRASIRGLLSSIWKRAIEWGYWREINPVSVVRLGGRKAPRAKYEKGPVSAEHLRMLLLSVREDVGLIIETLYWTGLRISECLGLKVRSVDMAHGWLNITERQCRGDIDSPKSRRGIRVVPLGLLAERYARLCAGRPAGEFLFKDSRGRPYRDCELLANYLTPIMERLGIKRPGMGWHAFRHTHATMLSEVASPFEVQAQLGHADISTTQIYIHPVVARRETFIRAMQVEFYGPATGHGSVQ